MPRNYQSEHFAGKDFWESVFGKHQRSPRNVDRGFIVGVGRRLPPRCSLIDSNDGAPPVHEVRDRAASHFEMDYLKKRRHI